MMGTHAGKALQGGHHQGHRFMEVQALTLVQKHQGTGAMAATTVPVGTRQERRCGGDAATTEMHEQTVRNGSAAPLLHENERRPALFHPTRSLWRQWEGSTAVWDVCAATYRGRGPAVTVALHAFKVPRDARYAVSHGRVAAVLEETFIDAIEDVARDMERQLGVEVWERVKGPALARLALWFYRRDGYSRWRHTQPIASRLAASVEGASTPTSFDDVRLTLERWEAQLAAGVAACRANRARYVARSVARHRDALVPAGRGGASCR